MNQPPFLSPPRKPHLCFSGDPSCSGCAPCSACLEKVRTYVLPMAMSAAGYAQNPEQARVFFDAYTRLGWPRLQEAMTRDPQHAGPAGDPGLRGQYMMVDVFGLLDEVQEYRMEIQARMAMNISAQLPPGPPSIPGAAPHPGYPSQGPQGPFPPQGGQGTPWGQAPPGAPPWAAGPSGQPPMHAPHAPQEYAPQQQQQQEYAPTLNGAPPPGWAAVPNITMPDGYGPPPGALGPPQAPPGYPPQGAPPPPYGPPSGPAGMPQPQGVPPGFVPPGAAPEIPNGPGWSRAGSWMQHAPIYHPPTQGAQEPPPGNGAGPYPNGHAPNRAPPPNAPIPIAAFQTPISADDLAAAGQPQPAQQVPVPPASTPKSQVSFGNVMTVPPGMEDHLTNPDHPEKKA